MGTDRDDQNSIANSEDHEGEGQGITGEQQTEGTSEHQQHGEELQSLRARRAELEERLVAARSALSSARERKDFMTEEVEQAREYGEKLAQEMSRLGRIAQTLPPEQSASLEKLRRLVVTLTEVERQESALRKEARAREDALRAEIDDFVGGRLTRVEASDDGSKSAEVTESLLVETAAATETGGEVVGELPVDDPLAVASKSGEDGGESTEDEKGSDVDGARASRGSSLYRMLVADATTTTSTKPKRETKRDPKREGRALLAMGLDRIEAAYEAASAERESMASRLSRLRLAVAKRQRQEDAAPGHAELLQYLLRFEELGHHAVERQNQLRRCRAERSTLALTRDFLANHARLMDTIASGVEEASKGSKGAREAYLRQLEGIVRGVEEHLGNQTRLLNGATNRRKGAEQAREAVMEERKRFLNCYRELTEECYRYDALTAHLALMRR